MKKRAVYRAALDGAMEDGVVSDRERAVLARVADELGLTLTEAIGNEPALTSVREG